MAASFSVLVLTAPPPGHPSDSTGGALVKIDGREALLRSVELFLNRDNVPQVQVVVTPETLEEAKRKYGPHLSFSGVKLLSGGPKWSNQLNAGVEKISAECSHVIVHDAARPVVAYSDIDALMEAATSGAAAASIVAPLRAALIETDEGDAPVAIHPPGRYRQLLTPQVFTRDKFLDLAKSGTEIHASQLTLVPGSPLNIRLSGSGDATLAKAMMNLLPKPKIKPPSSPFEEAQW